MSADPKLPIRYDAAAPGPLRKTAECARAQLEDLVPITVPIYELKLFYVCENKFRVQNTGMESADVQFTCAGD